MRRRLVAHEREVCSLGRLTLTTHRVILIRAGLLGERSEAVLLRHVVGTRLHVPHWGSPRLEILAGSARLVLRHADVRRLRDLADHIDRGAEAGQIVASAAGSPSPSTCAIAMPRATCIASARCSRCRNACFAAGIA
jgi:hypothetical protein